MDLDRDRIEAIVHAVADRLEGDWLLVGGALVALWFEPGRTTEDVDLVAVEGSADARLALFELAEDLGLPVEALNTAADFFVHRVTGWRGQIDVLHKGARGTVYRPSPTLLLLLKIRRLSARDLEDCKGLLKFAASMSLPVDVKRVLRALDDLPPPDDRAQGERRKRLRRRLEAHG